MTRDSAILRFIYTFETVWKAAQLYLVGKEAVEAGSPVAVIRACWQAGVLDERQTEVALRMARDRNLTVHTYHEALALELYGRLCAHASLLSAWLHHTDKDMDDLMISPRLNDSGIIEDSELADLSKQYGFTYYLTTSSYSGILDGSKELRKVASCSLFSIGSVPGTGFALYKCLKDYPRVLPEGEITNHRRGLSIRCSPGSHEIKYRPVPGLRAFQDHTELEIRKSGEFSFQIHSTHESEIEIRFDMRKLWLDLCPWKWRHNQNP